MDAIKQIIAEQLGINAASVDPHKAFAELGADSLDFIEIVMGVEDRFGIRISDHAFLDREQTRIGDFINQIAKVVGVEA